MAYLLLAQRHLDGWLPLAALMQARAVRQWFAAYAPQHAGDHHAMLSFMSERLTAEKAHEDAALASGVVLHQSGLAVRRKQPYIAPADVHAQVEDEHETAGAATTTSAESIPPAAAASAAVTVGSDHVTLVRVPAHGGPVQEVRVPSEGCLLTRLAAALGCPDESNLVIWGRVGHKAYYVAPPPGAQQQLSNDAAAAVMAEVSAMLPPPQPQAIPNPDASVAEAARRRKCAGSSGANGGRGGGVSAVASGLAPPPPPPAGPADRMEAFGGYATNNATGAWTTMSAAAAGTSDAMLLHGSSGLASGISSVGGSSGGSVQGMASVTSPAAAAGGIAGSAGGASTGESRRSSATDEAGGNGGGSIFKKYQKRVMATTHAEQQQAAAAAAADSEAASQLLQPALLAHLCPPQQQQALPSPGESGPSCLLFRAPSTSTLKVEGGGPAVMDWAAAAAPAAAAAAGAYGSRSRQGAVTAQTSPVTKLQSAAAGGGGGTGAQQMQMQHYLQQEDEVRGPLHERPPPPGAPTPFAVAGEHEEHGHQVKKIPEPSLYSRFFPGSSSSPGRGSAAEASDEVAAAKSSALAAGRAAAAATAAPLNLRASWLAGKPVRGDALFSLARLSPAANRRFVCMWRSYSAVDFWRSVSALFPAAQYGRELHAPLVASLPRVLRSPSSWVGPLPRALLSRYVAHHTWCCSEQYSREVVDADQPQDEATVTLTVRHLTADKTLVFEVTDEPEAAAQAAALKALHALQRLDAALLLGRPTSGVTARDMEAADVSADVAAADAAATAAATAAEPAGPLTASAGEEEKEEEAEIRGSDRRTQKPQGGAALDRKPSAAAGDVHQGVGEEAPGGPVLEAAPPSGAAALSVQVLEPGEQRGRAPVDGMVAKIYYRLFIRRCGEAEEEHVVEKRDAFNFELGSGCVLPGIEAAARQLRSGGTAAVTHMPVCLDGAANPLGLFPSVECCAELELLHIALPKRPAPPAGYILFNPPLSQQRHGFIANQLRALGCSSLLDVGCGEVRFLEHCLLESSFTPLRDMIGIDADAGVLKAGGRRLERLAAASSFMTLDSGHGSAGGGPIGRDVAAAAAESQQHVPMDTALTEIAAPEAAAAPVAGESQRAEHNWSARVALLSGNAFTPALCDTVGWGGLAIAKNAVEAVTCTEVVEHLDPEPLR